MTLTPQLREAFEYHRANGGVVTPGHLQYALRTARNELALKAHIEEDLARIRWIADDDIQIDDWAEELQKEAGENLAAGIWESRACIIEARGANGSWQTVASLWGIVSTFDAYDTYPRVVEGELAGEALEEISKTRFSIATTLTPDQIRELDRLTVRLVDVGLEQSECERVQELVATLAQDLHDYEERGAS